MAEMQGELQRVTSSTLDAQGAANLWAATTGLDLVSALNRKAGTTGLELNAVWRQLTGGTGEANAESRSARSNLLTVNQASLETDTTGWVATANAAIARSTAQFLDGAASLSITATAIGTSSASTSEGASGRPVVAGQSYTAQINARAATIGRAILISLNWFNAAGGFISNPQAAGTDVATGWTVVSVTAVAPTGAAFAAVQMIVNDAAQLGGEVHYIDKIGLFLGTTATWSL